jgi:hypothetical protein
MRGRVSVALGQISHRSEIVTPRRSLASRNDAHATSSAATFSCCRLAAVQSYDVEAMHPVRVTCLSICASLAVCAAGCATNNVKSVPTSGRVTVGVTSRGPGVERMTFTVSIEPAGVEGPVKGDIGIFTSDDTPAGTHVVRLKNLPGGCRVDGDNERKITVAAGRSTTVRFVVTCA